MPTPALANVAGDIEDDSQAHPLPIKTNCLSGNIGKWNIV
jgi:hypothetical protein